MHDPASISRQDEKVGWDPAVDIGTGLKEAYRVGISRHADYIKRAFTNVRDLRIYIKKRNDYAS
jgi:hypothetical protein